MASNSNSLQHSQASSIGVNLHGDRRKEARNRESTLRFCLLPPVPLKIAAAEKHARASSLSFSGMG
ncbi:hypothetical protein KY284_012684 [Solanum tuberosum]|nr:hypothetical protein KY284_012684 [Solanum tuberosum]